MVLHTEDIDESILADAREQNLRVIDLAIAGPVSVELTQA